MGLLAGGFFTTQGSGGDIIDMQDALIENEQVGGGVTAEGIMYGSGANKGKMYGSDGSPETYRYDFVTPTDNADQYQVKWQLFSGDAPDTTSTAVGVWEALSVDDFECLWGPVSGDNEINGAITVSIRKGTSPTTLATCVWTAQVTNTKT